MRVRGLHQLAVLTLTVWAVACGGGAGTDAPEYTARDRGVVSETTGEGAEESMIEALNRRAREGAVTETLHGVEVSDPYRALETESALTTEWIDVQTARTAGAIAEWSNSAMAARLEENLRIGVLGAGAIAGDSAFISRRDGDREQPALYVRSVRTGTERLLIDPLTYGARGALDWYFVSPTGRYVAFGISTNGDERSTLRVMETATGTLLPDTIEHAKWSEVAWLHAETGFYYRRYPREGEPDFSAEEPDAYHPRLFFHALGTDPNTDPLVFSPSDPTAFPAAHVSGDDRYVVLNDFRGWSASDVLVFDRGASARTRLNAPDESHPFVPVVMDATQLYQGEVHGGRLYVLTNDGAPRYQLFSVPVADAANRAAWTVVVPESEHTIEGWHVVGDRLVLHVIDAVSSRLLVRRMDGSADGEIELPTRGAVSGFATDAEGGHLLFGFSSYVHAPSVHVWNAGNARGRGRGVRMLAQVDAPDLSGLTITQASVASADGTPINVYLAHRADLVRDGNAPVLLNAYGGFNISLLPGFQRHPLYWMERGGVFAVANLRGGGEFGESWHRDGNLANKEHVFQDMEAVIRWLGTGADAGGSGLSRPERIGITGGSNGGLLMGAMITRAPETFGAAASYVGLYDMVRYHRFPPAELWVTEYGSSEDATQFGWLSAYSPYHRVRAGMAHPAILIETADHDTRVHWGHSTKFAALLQEASGEPDPAIYFYRERDVGHGAGTPVSAMVHRYVRMYAFLEHALGVPRYVRP
jgi:prolyl oligopeptidase